MVTTIAIMFIIARQCWILRKSTLFFAVGLVIVLQIGILLSYSRSCQRAGPGFDFTRSINGNNLNLSRPAAVQTVTVPPPSMASKLQSFSYQDSGNNSQREERGYIMGLHACDQLTGGAMNFMIYQCLASHLGSEVYAVEPFVVESSLGVYIWDTKSKEDFDRKNNVRLSDIYDTDQWHSISDQKQIRRLVPWKEFVKQGPREMIYVTRTKSQHCGYEPQFTGFLETFGFQVVRNVCLDDQSSIKDLKFKIYGSYNPSTVVVIFRWYWIMTILGTPCHEGAFWRSQVVMPSKRILHDAHSYIGKYLGAENRYISIMVRLEHIVIRRGQRSRNDVVKDCLGKLVKQWKALAFSHQLNTTFVTLDTGQFGSNTLSDNAGGWSLWSQTHPIVIDFMNTVYGNKLSYEEWENTFLDVSGLSTTSAGVGGYIAILQKTIASHGRCLILGGGGSFQGTASRQYSLVHADVGYSLCEVHFGITCS